MIYATIFRFPRRKSSRLTRFCILISICWCPTLANQQTNDPNTTRDAVPASTESSLQTRPIISISTIPRRTRESRIIGFQLRLLVFEDGRVLWGAQSTIENDDAVKDKYFVAAIDEAMMREIAEKTASVIDCAPDQILAPMSSEMTFVVMYAADGSRRELVWNGNIDYVPPEARKGLISAWTVMQAEVDKIRELDAVKLDDATLSTLQIPAPLDNQVAVW